MKKTILLSLLLLVGLTAQIFAQKDIKKAKQYLEKQIKQNEKYLLSKDKQQILNADIIEASLFTEQIGTLIEGNLLKTDGNISAFKNAEKLITSQEFIKAINPSFSLKTVDDAAKLRLVFIFSDSNRSRHTEVFKQDGKWCFVYKEWFGELSYYEVSTSKTGQITNIKTATKKFKPNFIAEALQDGNYVDKNAKFSTADKELINKSLKKIIKDYRITLKPISFKGISGDLKFYKGVLAVLYFFNNDFIEAKNLHFIMLDNKNKYEIVFEKEELLEKEGFMKAISSSYSIKNEADAKKIEALFDELKPADKEHKKLYKKDNVWCFVRSKFFDDLRGFLVLIDKTGKIQRIRKVDNINEESILEIQNKELDKK